ncbi:hypothetical protein JE959_001762 [Aeromonas veronii]|nr:hypothetical protein [Aeromonas veronii]
MIFKNVSDYEGMAHLDGKAFTITGIMIDPDSKEAETVDPSCMPQVAVRFAHNGEETSLTPDEMDEQNWPQELADYMLGMKSFEDGTAAPDDIANDPARFKSWDLGFAKAVNSQ